MKSPKMKIFSSIYTFLRGVVIVVYLGAKHIFIGGTTLKSTHLNNSIPDFTSSGVREQGLALEDKYLGPSILIILIYVSKMSKS